jgi:hypothetical protein
MMPDELDPQVSPMDRRRNRMADVVIGAVDAQRSQFPRRPQLSRISAPWLYRSKGSYEFVDVQRLLGLTPRLPVAVIGSGYGRKHVAPRPVRNDSIDLDLLAHDSSAESQTLIGIVQMSRLQSIWGITAALSNVLTVERDR